MRTLLLSALAASAAFITPAHAFIDELRLGVVEHNILDEENKEEGQNIQGEIVFSPPEFLELLGHPRPWILASVSGEDDRTSWYGAGLYWRWEFLDGWALEPGFGYVVHDGEIDGPNAEPNRILFGSEDLFRETIALERELGPNFAVQAYFEHLSHGQILGSGRNQGTEEAGVRAIFRFRPM